MRSHLLAALLLGLPLCGQEPAPKPGADPPAVGSPAPPFRLNDQEGRMVAVGGKAKTWTVIAFYPKAATPG